MSLVAGGESGAGDTILSSAELYNQITNSWSSAGSMAAARLDARATLLSNGDFPRRRWSPTIHSTSCPARIYTIQELSDITLNSVSTKDSNELTVDYRHQHQPSERWVQSFQIGILPVRQTAYRPHCQQRAGACIKSQRGALDKVALPIHHQSSNGDWGMNANKLGGSVGT